MADTSRQTGQPRRFSLISSLALAVVASLSVSTSLDQRMHAAELNVIPTPQRVILRNTSFLFSGPVKIVLGSNSPEEKFDAQQINEELKRWNCAPLPVEVVRSGRPVSGRYVFIGSASSHLGKRLLEERGGTIQPEMKLEGYILDVNERDVTIVAESEQGKFYGVMTLLQMMQRKHQSVAVPGATIHDFPMHSLRGISDDISRGQVSTIENFKKIIRFLARYKMNAYFPYIEDMFSFKTHPSIGKGRGALTSGEFKELDRYAQHFHVQIIPIFQTLGHCENLLSIPEYIRYAEYPGGRTLNLSDENIYDLLDDMIRELCSSYSAPYFHMGADETRDVGLGASKDRVERLGLATVLSEHYSRVADIIRKYGKKPMIYGDMLLKNPEILGMILKDVTIVDWNYDPQFRYDSPEAFTKAGFPILVSPAVRNYRGPFLDYLNSFENIRRLSCAGYENRSAGLLISSWNDYGGEELRELNYYGYAWGAQCAWQPFGADVAGFNADFFRDFFGTTNTDAIGSAYAILSSPANNYTWYELWRHPMLPFMPATPLKGHSPVIMERLQSIESTMPLVLSLLKKSESLVSTNKVHLQYLSFVARLNLWFARKVQSAEKVKELSRLAADTSNKDSVGRAIILLCRGVIEELSQRKTDFAKLWKKTNRVEGLEFLLMRYDRQRSFWEEKIDQVKRGEFLVDPEIESKWIYHADIGHSSPDTQRVQHAYFRRAFVAPKGIRSATIQLIGDTYVKLFINGHDACQVYVRRSNSLFAEHQRIRQVDMLPLLTDSTNVIAAEAWNYSLTGSAGLNVYGEIKQSDGSLLKITSDSTWRTAITAGAGWRSGTFDVSSWDRAVERPYPYEVDRPDFDTGRASWIEQ